MKMKLIALTLSGLFDAFKPSVKTVVERAGVTYDERCVAPLESFQGVTLVGTLLLDAGCRWSGYVADGAYHADVRKASGALDWSKLDGPGRQKLALAWVKEVLRRDQVLDAAAQLPADRFRAPVSTLRPDGSVHVEAWCALPAGMEPVWRAERIALDVDTAGNFGAEQKLERFEKRR